MTNNIPSPPEQPPFGTYALSPWRNALRRLAGEWAGRWRLLSSIFRRASKIGLREPFDVEPIENYKLRLFPSNNATDKNAYIGLKIGPGNSDIDAIGRALQSFASETFNFVDVGGNSGTYSVAAAAWAKKMDTEICVLAIEANPEMETRYRFNTAASALRDVTVMGFAVSDSTGSVFLNLENPNLGAANVVQHPGANRVIEVPSRPLKDILVDAGMQRLDFLKIDIEGQELTALRPFFQSAPKSLFPARILIEVAHDSFDGIDPLLRGNGYELHEDLGHDRVYALKTGA